jgi:hypothetical protein
MSASGLRRGSSLLGFVCAIVLVGPPPALAAGDLSQATLERADLPPGFRPVPPARLSEAGISTRQVGKTFAAYLTDAKLLAYSVHATASGDEVVESFLVGPLTATEQEQIDRELADRRTIVDSFSGALVTPWADVTEPRILGTDGVGDASVGFEVVLTTPSALAHLQSLFGGATGDRASVGLVFGRRGAYLHFVAVVHIGAGRPRAHVVELARILDGKVGYRQGIEGFGPDGATGDDDPNVWLLLVALVSVVAAGLILGTTLRQRRRIAAIARTPAPAVTAPQPWAPGLPGAPATSTSAPAAPGPGVARARLVGRLVSLAGWAMVLGWLGGLISYAATSETLAWMAWGKSSIAIYSPPVLEFAWGVPLIVLGTLMRRTSGRGAADERIVFPPQRIGRRLIGLGIGALPLVGLAFLSTYVVTGTIRDAGAELQLGAWVGLAAAILGLVGALAAIVVGIGLRRHRPEIGRPAAAPWTGVPAPPAMPPPPHPAGRLGGPG